MTILKILFCIDTLGSGGAERIMLNIVNGLQRNPSYEIDIFLLLKTGVHLETLSENIHLYSFLNRPRKGLRAFIRFLPAKWLHKLLIRKKYDVEIAFLEGGSTKIVAGCPNQQTRKYAWVHSDVMKHDWANRYYISEKQNRKCYASFDKVIAVSTEVKNAVEQRFDCKAYFLHNCLDNHKIQKLAEEYEENIFRKDRFNLVTVGSLQPIKGIERLIEVHENLKQRGLLVCHYILGTGELAEELRQKIQEKELGDRMILKGFVQNPYPYIKNADLYVCSSYAEGYNSAVCEAVLLGTPVVTTDCAGMKDILGKSVYGLIVDNSSDGLLEGIRKMIEQPDFYQEYKNRVQQCETVLGYEQCLQEVENLLTDNNAIQQNGECDL